MAGDANFSIGAWAAKVAQIIPDIDMKHSQICLSLCDACIYVRIYTYILKHTRTCTCIHACICTCHMSFCVHTHARMTSIGSVYGRCMESVEPRCTRCAEGFGRTDADPLQCVPCATSAQQARPDAVSGSLLKRSCTSYSEYCSTDSRAR